MFDKTSKFIFSSANLNDINLLNIHTYNFTPWTIPTVHQEILFEAVMRPLHIIKLVSLSSAPATSGIVSRITAHTNYCILLICYEWQADRMISPSLSKPFIVHTVNVIGLHFSSCSENVFPEQFWQSERLIH